MPSATIFFWVTQGFCLSVTPCFFGLGAFVTAVAIIHIPGLALWNAILIGVASTVISGFVFGSLLLRHKGAYFALLTLAFNALFYAVATKWHSVTGGDDGLSITRPDLNLWFTSISMGSLTHFYYLTLIVVGASITFCCILHIRLWAGLFSLCAKTRSG